MTRQTAAQRSAARYSRRRAKGDTHVALWLTPATLAVLRRLCAQSGKTQEQVVADALAASVKG